MKPSSYAEVTVQGYKVLTDTHSSYGDFERQTWEDKMQLDKNGKMPALMIGGTLR